jgi:peptidoglycan/xylan/chitin deacetylase (PgdA/CDA1 family)
MNWEELRLLHRAGFEIGSHSLTHPNLTMLDKKQISRELSRSRDLIQIKLDCIVSKFAYPYGVYNEQVINMAMRHYSWAYGLNQPEKVTRWNIPRKLIVSI